VSPAHFRPRPTHGPSPTRPTATTPRKPAPTPAEPLGLGHPASWLAVAALLLSLALSITFRIYEKDFWQHLAVGRAIWSLGHVPTTELWTWPTYGAPDVNASWGFRVLLWPFWRSWGVWGLYVWRWGTTLAIVALAWLATRRMGAKGLTPLVVFALTALVYRQRSQVRPETFVSVLLAAQIAILETRRNGGRDLLPLLIPIALLWANTHISWHLGIGVLVAYTLAAVLDRSRARANAIDPRRLAWVTVAAFAVSFVNPWGWRALWEPFDYVLHHASEPIMLGVTELQPVDFANNLRDLLPLILAGWIALFVWRTRRAGLDLAELLVAGGFLVLALRTQRFLGFGMVALAPYLARDLDAWVRSYSWPAWTRPAWTRAALAAAACLVPGIPEWSRSELPLGVGIEERQYPIAACDWIAAHGVRGRAFNQFFNGGYLLWRFWPERDWLPFMDIHQTGTTEDRYTYAFALHDPRAWRDLDTRHRFDWALLRREPYQDDRLLEFLDADSSYALVFLDDAAALWVRRDGSSSALADSFGYRLLPAGGERLATVTARMNADTSVANGLTRELTREAAGSRWNALAESRLGSLALAHGDLAAARAHLERAIASNPAQPRAHERLGLVALAEGRGAQALAEFHAELRIGPMPEADLRLGQAYRVMGDRARARACYERALRADPGNAAAAESLRGIGGE
jgi:predicted negative regulator of RcsB-dependent stress response